MRKDFNMEYNKSTDITRICEQIATQFNNIMQPSIDNLNELLEITMKMQKQAFPLLTQMSDSEFSQFIESFLTCNQILIDDKWVPFIDSGQDLDDMISYMGSIAKIQNQTLDITLDEYMQTTVNDIFCKEFEDSIIILEENKTLQKIYLEALEAHKNEKYATCVFLINPFYERLIKEITNENKKGIKIHDLLSRFHNTLNQQKDVTKDDNDKLIDYFEKYVFYQFFSPSSIIENVPSRHVTMHGAIKQYPTKKASLNALLLLNILLISRQRLNEINQK